MEEAETKDTIRKPNPFTEKSAQLQGIILVLMMAGLYGIVTGIFYLIGGVIEGFDGDLVKDVVFNLFFGNLVIATSIALIRGKLLGLWLLIGTILLTMAYNFAFGRGFNVLMTLIGMLIVWKLFNHQKLGELR